MSAWFVGHPSEADLALFAGGEAGPLARWRVERHLETCPKCRQAVTDFFHLRDRLEPLGELPDMDWNGLAESIEAKVAEDIAPPPDRPRSLAGWAWPVGAAAAVALAAVLVLRQEPAAAPTRVSDAATESVIEELAAAPVDPDDPARDEAPASVATAPPPPARALAADARETEQAKAKEIAPAVLATDMLAVAPPPAPAGRGPDSVRERLSSALAAGGREALEAEARTLAERARQAPDSLDEDERMLADIYSTRGLDGLVAELATR